MSELEKDKEVARKRKNPLKDNPDDKLKVVAPLRDQQLEKLTKKLDDELVGQKIVNMWTSANSDRAEWLERQTKFLQEIDEFIEPIYPQALDWSSTIHLPVILTVCKTFHARMYAALMSIDPPFTCRSRQAANSDRAMLIEELVRYTLKDWCNENDGVDEQVDRWLWDWVTRGNGILKGRWHKKFTRYLDVEVDQAEDVELEQGPNGDSVAVPVLKEIEREIVKTVEVFNGPMVERVALEDVVIVGGEGDPQKADAVIQQYWLTSSELWSYADQKIFRKDIVEDVINSGKDSKTGSDGTGAIKQRQVEQGGQADVDKQTETDRYKVLEAYIKYDCDGSGIASDLIVWVHEASKKILRATYLRRVMPTGLIPYFNIAFHHRHGTEYAVGLVELLYSLGKEMDAMHNIKIDVGIISSIPFGFYKPTAASLKDNKLPLEPGALIPVDNPQTDVFFPNLGLRTSFGFQEEQALQVQVERLTSISDLNLGIVGGQGVTRTATGTRALLGEASNNLNVYIQRMNRGWRRALRYLFAQLQYRLPAGFQFRVLGDDGNHYWKQIKSREEIQGMFDFELEANSANSNKQIQIEQANMLYQMTQNPIDLQLGLITPLERYEALAYQLKVNGIKDTAKFIRKPQGQVHQFSPLEIADRILAGVDVPLDPTQDLQGFINLVQQFAEEDDLNGQLSQHQMAALIAKAQDAEALMKALQQAQATQLAGQQQQMNAQAAMTPSNMQPVSVNQSPPPGEGGSSEAA